jgi:membrane protein implicated in regulation of membrane protease activity
MAKVHRKRRIDGDGNDLFNRSKWGFVENEIKPDVGGRIKYQSSWWPAKEINNEAIGKGERVEVIKREGIFQVVKRCL